MQGKQSLDPYLSNLFSSESYFEPVLIQHNLEPKYDLQFNAVSITSIKNDEPINRGKGRPKGQKNCKDKERRQKSTIEDQNKKKGHWSSDENKKYHWFLEIYNKHFICKEMRRLDKIFKTMALFVGTREAQQCRSHHQKMQKKYHSFSNILLYLRKFHYGTEDHKLIEQDMQKNQIREEITFLNVNELQKPQSPKITPPTPSVIQQSKLDLCGEQSLKIKLQFQQDFFDLLGENYEHMLHLNNNMF